MKTLLAEIKALELKASNKIQDNFLIKHWDHIEKEIRSLSSGTLASITGLRKYDDIEDFTEAFVDYAVNSDILFNNWQDAFKEMMRDYSVKKKPDDLLAIFKSKKASKASVGHFLTVLAGALTRLDQRETEKESKRGVPNIYRLSLLLEAKGKVEQEVKKYLDDDSAEAMKALKEAMEDHFHVDSAPELRKFMKQIDAWVSEKKTPKYASEVAKTILEQLGGRRFILMTGAKNLVGSSNSLSFRIGRNSASINGVRVELQSNDTYTMSFLRMRKAEVKVVKKFEGVYFDQLQEIFTQVTGMYTRL